MTRWRYACTNRVLPTSRWGTIMLGRLHRHFLVSADPHRVCVCVYISPFRSDVTWFPRWSNRRPIFSQRANPFDDDRRSRPLSRPCVCNQSSYVVVVIFFFLFSCTLGYAFLWNSVMWIGETIETMYKRLDKHSYRTKSGLRTRSFMEIEWNRNSIPVWLEVLFVSCWSWRKEKERKERRKEKKSEEKTLKLN